MMETKVEYLNITSHFQHHLRDRRFVSFLVEATAVLLCQSDRDGQKNERHIQCKTYTIVIWLKPKKIKTNKLKNEEFQGLYMS